MSATVLEIVEKVIPNPFYPSVPQNFVLREADSIPAQIILENSNVSLYCLDDENRRALFVETAPGTDLIHAPFYYVTQYEQAQRVIAVPYDEVHTLTDTVSDGKLILIHSTGRCGSTLISSALNELPGIVSLSEPDVYTQIAMLRAADNRRDEEYARLLKSCTRLICKDMPTAALKFRALVIHIGDLLFEAFPDAKNVFLYRHAETWAQSMNSGFTAAAPAVLQDPTFMQFLGTTAPLTMPYIQRHARMPEIVEAFALVWLSILDTYLKLHAQGVPFLALRYEDIIGQPKAVLAAMLDYCGLGQGQIEAAYSAFGKDSQEGTALSREYREEHAAAPLTPQQYAEVRAVLQEHAVIQSPDFIVPDTLTFGTKAASAF